MNLAIDIGNTRTKAAIFDGDTLVDSTIEPGHYFPFLYHWCARYGYTSVIISSTIDYPEDVMQVLREKLPNLLWLDAQTPLPITNLYETPETLGKDRIAAVVGAYTQCPGKDILVIDAGTAITYELIDAQGRYLGGNISPGVQMRFDALNHFTDKLPLVAAEGRKLEIGKDTETAIRAGVLEGVKHEMTGYITSLRAKYPGLFVFLTGGDRISFDTNIKNIQIHRA